MALKITDFTEAELKEWMIAQGEKPFRLKQLLQWIYFHRVQDWEAMSNLSKSFRQKVAVEFTLERIKIVNHVEAPDGTVKFLQRLPDGEFIESVLLRHDDHDTVCVSTQVGCAMNCRFCLTASMGLKRNLTPGEIVDQVMNASEFLPERRQVRNIVFMGMGEPFHNYENVMKALSILLLDSGLNFSSRRITISTSGMVPEIRRFGQEKEVKANLAISLNGVTQEARAQLMPVSRRHSLEELVHACKEYPLEARKRITFEYILLDGVTDSMRSAKMLVSLLHGIKSKVNLIPFNEHPDLEFKAPSERKVKEFQQYLLDHGLLATLRVSRGQGISAACGQLAVKANHESNQQNDGTSHS